MFLGELSLVQSLACREGRQWPLPADNAPGGERLDREDGRARQVLQEGRH